MPKKGQKKLRYKFAKREGRVELSGMNGNENESQIVGSALSPYGFVFEGGGVWADEIAPADGVILEDIIHSLQSVVPLSFRTELSKRGKVTFFAKVGESKESKGASIFDALSKAHAAWNREGRPIAGVPVFSVLERALEEINGNRASKTINEKCA